MLDDSVMKKLSILRRSAMLRHAQRHLQYEKAKRFFIKTRMLVKNVPQHSAPWHTAMLVIWTRPKEYLLLQID